MTALIVFLWIANMLVDTGGQLFFKAAASEHTAVYLLIKNKALLLHPQFGV